MNATECQFLYCSNLAVWKVTVDGLSHYVCADDIAEFVQGLGTKPYRAEPYPVKHQNPATV